MHERVLSAPNGQPYCQLSYDTSRQWLLVVWQGYVGPEGAREGALTGLAMLQEFNCPYLFNDNSRLEGPWFDSLFWLSQEWGPAAARAGLRYVAHVTQAQMMVTSYVPTPAHQLFKQFEIQIFEEPAEAVEWLSGCQTQEQST